MSTRSEAPAVRISRFSFPTGQSISKHDTRCNGVAVITYSAIVVRQECVVDEVLRHWRCGSGMNLHHLLVVVETCLDDLVDQAGRQVPLRHREVVEPNRLVAVHQRGVGASWNYGRVQLGY